MSSSLLAATAGSLNGGNGLICSGGARAMPPGAGAPAHDCTRPGSLRKGGKGLPGHCADGTSPQSLMIASLTINAYMCATKKI